MVGSLLPPCGFWNGLGMVPPSPLWVSGMGCGLGVPQMSDPLYLRMQISSVWHAAGHFYNLRAWKLPCCHCKSLQSLHKPHGPGHSRMLIKTYNPPTSSHWGSFTCRGTMFHLVISEALTPHPPTHPPPNDSSQKPQTAIGPTLGNTGNNANLIKSDEFMILYED